MCRPLRRFDAEGRIAACAALASHVVAAFGSFRQGEELLEPLKRAIDQCRRKAVVGDDREPETCIGCTHGSSKAAKIGVVVGEVDWRDGGSDRRHGAGL